MENVIDLKKVIIFFWCFFTVISCTTEKTLFEKDIWWYGHWQNLEESDYFFSIGQKPVGINEIITPQFFISTRDSIYSNFHLKNLEEFNHSKEWKIILTNENKYIKIREIDETHIELSGPANSLDELNINITEYLKLPNHLPPPIPDSILFVN